MQIQDVMPEKTQNNLRVCLISLCPNILAVFSLYTLSFVCVLNVCDVCIVCSEKDVQLYTAYAAYTMYAVYIIVRWVAYRLGMVWIWSWYGVGIFLGRLQMIRQSLVAGRGCLVIVCATNKIINWFVCEME